MFLFPPCNARVKCSIGSRRVALVVATSLCLFWNMVVRRYFAENPYNAPDDACDTDEGPAISIEEEESPAGGLPKPPAVAVGVDWAALRRAGGADGASDVGAADDCTLSGRRPFDADVPVKAPASETSGAVPTSAKDIVRVERPGGAAAGDAATQPLPKMRETNEAEESPPRPDGGDVPAPLVGWGLLGANVTGAPPERPPRTLEPPSPHVEP